MKKVISIVAGVAAGFVIVFIGNATTPSLYPPPLGLNYMDKNVMMDYISKIPSYIMVIMMIFWLLSSFLGGMLAARINRIEWKQSAVITGSILMAASILNLIMISHPKWMWLAVLVGYIPAAFIGGWLVKEKPIPTANT